MIVLCLTAAEVATIRDHLPQGSFRDRIIAALAEDQPALVLFRPNWAYMECITDEATADRCFDAITRVLQARQGDSA